MGKIKEGKSSIIGNAGEYLVVGELLRRGIIAGPAPRNAPNFDIIATNTNGTKFLNIRVKTKETSNSWVWMTKKDGDIFKYLHEENDYTVLVDLRTNEQSPEYYIVPTSQLNSKLKEIFDLWIKSSPKRGIKSHNINNRMRRIGEKESHWEWLNIWKQNWVSLNAHLS
jgi:hypothetical protein